MIKYIFFIIIFIITACEKGEKVNIKRFFPDKELNNKVLTFAISKSPINVNKVVDILKFNGNCIKVYRKYVLLMTNNIAQNKKKAKSLFKYCINKKNIIEENENFKTIILDENKKWISLIKSYENGKIIRGECKVVKKYQDLLFNKNYKMLEVNCKYKVKNFSITTYYILAEGMGIIERGRILNNKKYKLLKLTTISH